MNKDIENRLLKVLNQSEDLSFLKEKYRLDADISTLGISSLMFIKLIVGLENEFDIEFDDEDLDIEKLKTFEDFISHIERLITQA